MRAAYQGGMADAWAELATFKKDRMDTGQVTSGELFGDRQTLGNNYLYRMAAAVMAIYGNSKQEAMYPGADVDSTGAPLTGANTYTYRFPPGRLPPVNAFWSLTVYEMPQSLLVANPMNRYLINSPMLPGLVPDPDGGYTLHLQHTSPGPAMEANWLPTPQGPFRLVLRLYWPKDEALSGQWRAPRPIKT
ncbi:MAG: hypothetical protein QOC62_2368 [Mycobacterium sp.]|jgi:hypothetical protein|nr:hypothetical protein [Mycobacterium sp.]